MFIDQSGITAFKTMEAIRNLIPKWMCMNCGNMDTEDKIECGLCSHKRPDPHNIIAIRMLMDYEEKLDGYMTGEYSDPNPKIFERYLMTIERHCKKYDLQMDLLRESTRKAINLLPKEKRANEL